MRRVSSYLKMRVLGAIESAPGSSIVSRIKHVSEQPFLDEDGRRFQFTWRTIQTWYSRYKKDGTTTVLSKPRSDKGKTRKMTPEEVLEAIEQVRAHFHGPHNVTSFYPGVHRARAAPARAHRPEHLPAGGQSARAVEARPRDRNEAAPGFREGSSGRPTRW